MTHQNQNPRHPAKSKTNNDPTVDTLEEIFESEGVEPKRSLINKLLFFWVKSTADAQARGVRIAHKVNKEL